MDCIALDWIEGLEWEVGVAVGRMEWGGVEWSGVG